MTTDPDTARSPAARRDLRLAAVGVLAASLVLIGFRLESFDLPLETDECNYAYIGARLLDGAHLYVDVWDHQPFGVFVLFAAVIRLFGDAPEVFRWMVVAFSLASLGLIYALLKRTGGLTAGIVGAFLFALVSSDPGTAGEGCNREIYMNTLILGAWYLAVCAPVDRRATLLLAGVALALGSAVKTVVAIHWVALVVWIVFCAGRNRAVRQRVADVALLAAGPLVLWLAAFAYFAATDRFKDFVDAVFLFNLGYSETDAGFFARFVQFFAPQRHPFIFDSALPLWLIGAAGTVWLFVRSFMPDTTVSVAAPRSGIGRSHAAALVLLVGASFVAVCLPGRFWPHYYYLMVPPMVIVAALSISRVIQPAQDALSGSARGLAVPINVIAALMVCGPVLWFQYHNYLSQDPLGITVKRYNTRDFWGRAHGLNVRSVTDPGDAIFVFGNDASIYYYAQRRCASRYTMITGLGDNMSGAKQRRAVLMDELRADPPRLILVVFNQKPFPEWKAFLDEYYGEPIGWDFHDRTGEAIMLVLCHKDKPVRQIDWNWDRSSITAAAAAMP